jgi:hypothetical protein
MRVVLAGPYYKGNLKGFGDWASEHAGAKAKCKFYPAEYGHGQWQRTLAFAVNPLNPISVLWIARADAMVTNYNNARLARIFRFFAPSITLVQTSHAIPFFSERPEFFRKLRVYDAVFAPSDWVRENFFVAGGLDPEKVMVTGFASLDILTREPVNKKQLHKDNNILSDTITVLIAPTLVFTPGMKAAIIPFDLDPEEYFSRLNEWAISRNAQVVIRPHHFTRLDAATDLERVFFRPANLYPDAQQLLGVTDVLVTDWSAIGVYYLAKSCPVIYLDVPPPASDGLAVLDGSDRAGYVAADFDSLLAGLDEAVINSSEHMARFREVRERVVEKAFGSTLDGLSGKRYYSNLLDLVGRKKSKEAGYLELEIGVGKSIDE